MGAFSDSRGQVIILLGPPGSGKGTQGALLASLMEIPEVSTGEMLRRECHSGTNLGAVIGHLLSSGQLVPDDLVNQVVANRLCRGDCEVGCILDGYPRTVSQAQFLDGLLEELNMAPPIALDFQVDCDEIVSRLSRRYYCAVCGRTSSTTSLGTAELICDQDGSQLLRRTDDNPASIRERLRLYEANAAAVVAYYRQKKYYEISASRPISEISHQVRGILQKVLTPVLNANPGQLSALA